MKSFALFILILLLGGCATTTPLRVACAEFGRSIWSDGQQRAGVLFQDGSQSIPVAGGTLWTFGDTFIGKPHLQAPPSNAQITGSVWATLAWLPAGKTNLPPALEYFMDTNGPLCPLKLFADEDQKHLRLWPAHGVNLGQRVYLYYSMIATEDKPGPWNFHGVGGGLAVADLPVKEFTRLRPGGRAQFPVTPIQILRVGKSLYLYEVSEHPKGLILARVAAAQIEQPAAYEFLSVNGWTANRALAKVILPEAYGQVSVGWMPARRRYVMATSSDFAHPLEIQLREAAHPEGPWSAPVRIAVPELPGKKTQLVYCTFLHPELSDAKSRRLVATFCRILKGNWELGNPEWVTVLLAPDKAAKL